MFKFFGGSFLKPGIFSPLALEVVYICNIQRDLENAKAVSIPLLLCSTVVQCPFKLPSCISLQAFNYSTEDLIWCPKFLSFNHILHFYSCRLN
jgi:hypothetical protein